MLQLSERIPTRIGPYALEDVLGSGGMGTVYRARGPDGSSVALKVLDQRIRNEEHRKRFEREAAIRIDHPNVVRLLGAGTEDGGLPFIAFELLKGRSLRDRLDTEAPPKPDEVRELGLQVCRGLAAAHAEGVVHRDLKPENLFLCEDGTVKILDFGIALVLGSGTRVTTTGHVMGTPWYVAPEQARGDRMLDARVDVWGLGAVMYECLTGISPFERETGLGTVLAILREPLEPVHVRAPHIPPPLARVVEKCLAKEPADRWSDAEALADVLERADLDEAPLKDTLDFPAAPIFAMGEQRVVAILLAEEVLDAEVLRGTVERWGGSFLRVMGRRAIGLFGGASWEGDELEHAAQAAKAARGAAVRMSVAAGRAMRDGTGISGSALQAAERACKLGVDGVAIDSRSARALSRSFTLETMADDVLRIGEVHRPSRVPSQAPLGETGVAWTIPPPGAPGPPPLLGRRAEMAQLEEVVRTVLDSHQSLAVLMVGPVGIGKSRLRRELERLLAEALHPVQVLRARADPLGRGSALGLLAEALREEVRQGHDGKAWPSIDGDSAEERREAVRSLAADALEDEQRVGQSVPFLGELLGVDMPESTELTAARADPQLMADRLRLALRDYLAARVERGPLALVMEDVHWADTASLEVLEDLLDRFPDAPLLLCATARPWIGEVRPDFLARQQLVRIEPRGLRADDVAALAEATAGLRIPEPLARRIAKLTGGNPLFVEQIVLETTERGMLDADSSVELPMPVSVEAAVQSRLDHLPPFEKDACKRAAILGSSFTQEELSGVGVVDAKGVLRSLRQRGLVAAQPASRRGRERELRFRSALVADVAYQMLSDEVRQDLHLKAAHLMAESAHADEETIAYHFERGGEPLRAGEAYTTASLIAARRGDGDKVLRCAERALVLGCPEDQRFGIHLARAESYQFLGKFADQATELDQARAHARTEHDRARVLAEHIGCLWWNGKQDEAIEVSLQAAEAAKAAGDPDLEALCWARRTIALVFRRGASEEAEESLARAEALADAASLATRGRIASAHFKVAQSRGDLADARYAVATGLELYRAAGDLRRAVNLENTLADTYIQMGAYAEAERALRETIDHARRVGQRFAEASALVNLADSLTRERRTVEALAAADKARQIAEATSSPRLVDLTILSRIRARVAELGVAQGSAQAAELATQAAELAQRFVEHGVPQSEVDALAVAARAHLVAGQADEALEAATRAVERYRETGVAECGIGELFISYVFALEASNQHAAAEDARSQARERVLEQASRIHDLDWRRRFLEDVPANRNLLDRGETKPGTAPKSD